MQSMPNGIGRNRRLILKKKKIVRGSTMKAEQWRSKPERRKETHGKGALVP